jgi:hypothetical protein
VTLVESGPISHVELRSTDLDARQRETDRPISVRDERVSGPMEGQDRHRSGATELELDRNRGDRRDLGLASTRVDDREGGSRREPGREDRTAVDAIGRLERLDHGIHETGVGAVRIELPLRLGALGVRDDDEVTAGRPPCGQPCQRCELRGIRAESVEGENERTRMARPIRLRDRQLIGPGHCAGLQRLRQLTSGSNDVLRCWADAPE